MPIFLILLLFVGFAGAAALAFLAIRMDQPLAPALPEGGQSARVSAFVSDSDRGVSMADAREMQEEALAVMTSSDDLSDQLNAAAQLMTGGFYEESMDAYLHIAAHYPEEAGLCYSQVGAALYFLGRYDEAISYYQSAISYGADPGMMQDNIDEAVAALQSMDVHDDDDYPAEDDYGDDEDDDEGDENLWGGGEEE